MKYPKITGLIPEKEHFDSTAVNEGVWLTVRHVDAIEAALVASESAADVAVKAVNDQLTIANNNLKAAQDALTASQAVVSEKETVASTLATKVQELEAKVVALGGKPSGTGSTTTVTADPVAAEPVNGIYALNDPRHPANIDADQYTGHKINRSI